MNDTHKGLLDAHADIFEFQFSERKLRGRAQRRAMRRVLRKCTFDFAKLRGAGIKIKFGLHNGYGGNYFHPDDLTISIMPDLAVWGRRRAILAILHELGHAADFVYMTDEQRTRIFEAFAGPRTGSHGQWERMWPRNDSFSWWNGSGPYHDRVGEAFANAFVNAFSDFGQGPGLYRPGLSPGVIDVIRGELA